MTDHSSREQTLDAKEIARRFLKIGSTSFGGWSTTALLIEKEFVASGDLKQQDLKSATAYAQVLPGATQVIMVANVGHTLRGGYGALVATVAYLLPSIALMTVFAALYFSYFRSSEITSHLGGLVAALAGIILANAYRIGSKHVVGTVLWLVVIGSFIARLFFGIDALAIILVAGAGAVGVSFLNRRRSA